MGVAENIKRLRNNANLTQEELAKKLGITRPTVTQWETGWSQPRMGMVEKLSQVFGVPKSVIIEDNSDIPVRTVFSPIPAIGTPTVPVPLLGRVHAGNAGDPDVYTEVHETALIEEEYLEIDPECFVVDYEGDCMNKCFGEDTTSLVVSPNSPFGNGSIVVCAIDGTDYVVRRMFQTARELRLVPNSWNANHEVIVIPRDSEHTVEFKGKVLGCFKRFE